MFGHREDQATHLSQEQDPSVLNLAPRGGLPTASNRVSGNLARSGSISDCLRSDPSASASAEAPVPEIPTELKQTSQENSSVSSKPLSRRCCQERQLLGTLPGRSRRWSARGPPGRSRAEVQNSRPAQAEPPASPRTPGQLPLAGASPSPPASSNEAPPARTRRLAAGRSRGRP